MPDHFRYVLEGTGSVLDNADPFRQSQDDLRVFVIIEKRLRKFRIVEGCRRSELPGKVQVHLLSGFYRPVHVQPVCLDGAYLNGAVFTIIRFRLFKEGVALFGAGASGRPAIRGSADERILAEVGCCKSERSVLRAAAHIW